MSGINNENLQYVYRFISKLGDDWAKGIDESVYGNKDGNIEKSEFFMYTLNLSDWDGTGFDLSTKKDLINEFWDKFDVNKSGKLAGTDLREKNALNKGEEANLSKGLAKYIAIDKAVENIIKDTKEPEFLKGTDYVNELKNILTNIALNTNGIDENNAEEKVKSLLPEAQKEAVRKCTMKVVEKEWKEVLAGYPNYDINNDGDLSSLIDAYLKEAEVADENSLKTIFNDIRKIVADYMATANLESKVTVESNYGTQIDDTQLNKIQLERLNNDLKQEYLNLYTERLENSPSALRTAVNAIIKDYVDGLLKDIVIDENGAKAKFDELMNSAENFKSTVAGKKIERAFELYNLYGDVQEGSIQDGWGRFQAGTQFANEIYALLLESFGSEIANAIATNDGDDFWQGLLKEILKEIEKGGFIPGVEWKNGMAILPTNNLLDTLAVNEYILDYIIDNLSKAQKSLDIDDLGVNSLYTIYGTDKVYGSDKDEAELKRVQNAAINFCKNLINKNVQYKFAIRSVFGTDDYEAKINACTTVEEIDKLIDALKTKALAFKIVEANNPITWNEVTGYQAISIKTGKSYTQAFNVVLDGVKDANADIKYGVRYSTLSGSADCCTIEIDPETGVLTINATEAEGHLDVEIYVVINGVEMEAKILRTVTVEKTCLEKADELIATLDDIKYSDSTCGYDKVSLEEAKPTLRFYVNNSGEVIFSADLSGNDNYNTFIGKNEELTKFFNNELKTKIEEKFDFNLDALNLNQEQRDSLYNLVLFMTLSNTAVVGNMYSASTNLKALAKAVINNYAAAVDKLYQTENAGEYLSTAVERSLLNGRNTVAGEEDIVGGEANSDCSKGWEEYYTNNSTRAGNDHVYLVGTETYTTPHGEILMFKTGEGEDINEMLTKSMASILEDYIENYKDFINEARIAELFKQAQQAAYDNIKTAPNFDGNGNFVADQTTVDIYGYGDVADGSGKDTSSTNTATKDSVGWNYSVTAILINIMYQMEQLINQEILGIKSYSYKGSRFL